MGRKRATAHALGQPHCVLAPHGHGDRPEVDRPKAPLLSELEVGRAERDVERRERGPRGRQLEQVGSVVQ
eukprot:4012817-Pyramimonas_sp.AAC.1